MNDPKEQNRGNSAQAGSWDWASLEKTLAIWGTRVGVFTVVVGLGVVPAVGGHAPVHWSEWLAAALSAAAGWALLRPAAYLQRRCGSPSTSVSSSS